ERSNGGNVQVVRGGVIVTGRIVVTAHRSLHHSLAVPGRVPYHAEARCPVSPCPRVDVRLCELGAPSGNHVDVPRRTEGTGWFGLFRNPRMEAVEPNPEVDREALQRAPHVLNERT